MDAKIKELLTRLSFFAEDGMADKPIVEIAKQADALLLEVARKPNTQQPVAWIERYVGGGVAYDKYSDAVINLPEGVKIELYPALPVPRDVLMAFGEAVRDAAKRADFDIGEDVDLAAIADRYASKVQPEPVLDKPASVGRLRFHAGLPVRYVIEAAQRRYEHEESPEGKAERKANADKLLANVRPPEPMNQQGMRKKFEEWAPVNGYDIRPSRIGLPFADGFTNSAWEIWQAAIAAAEEAQGERNA